MLFAQLPERRQAIVGYILTIAVVGIVDHNDPRGSIGNWIWISVIFGIGWVVGFAFSGATRQAEEAKERARRAEREREERALLAVSEERARIARELHDVVAHSVSVIAVQAGGRPPAPAQPEQAESARRCSSIEQTGREAMAEMRRMVGVLRRPERGARARAAAEPRAPGQARRARSRVRPAGRATRRGRRRCTLPAGVDLTAYRIVQEALTNALKHARRAARARCSSATRTALVELERHRRRRRATARGDSGGHGLVGMRERVALYGGDLEAGPRPGGGYRRRARPLPVGGA